MLYAPVEIFFEWCYRGMDSILKKNKNNTIVNYSSFKEITPDLPRVFSQFKI